eukprot:418042_1
MAHTGQQRQIIQQQQPQILYVDYVQQNQQPTSSPITFAGQPHSIQQVVVVQQYQQPIQAVQPRPKDISLRVHDSTLQSRYQPPPFTKHPHVKCPFLQLTQVAVVNPCEARTCANCCCDWKEDDDNASAGVNTCVDLICYCIIVPLACILKVLFCGCCLCKRYCKAENRKCCLPCDIMWNALLCVPKSISFLFADLVCIACGVFCLAWDPVCCI